MKEKKPHGAPKGNRNAAKPADQRGVYVYVYLAPETVKLLAPFAAKRQRSKMIDKAIAEHAERHPDEYANDN